MAHKEWPAGAANAAKSTPLYSRPGVIQTSRPPEQTSGDDKGTGKGRTS